MLKYLIDTSSYILKFSSGEVMGNKRKYALLIVIIVIPLFMVSCGKGEESITPKPISDKQMQKTSYINLRPVKLQLHSYHQASFAGFYYAQEKGIYKNYGLNVQIKSCNPAKALSVIREGDADFVTMVLCTALREYDKNNLWVNIAQLSQKTSLLLAAKKSSGIRNLQDINQRKLGVWHYGSTEPTLIFLKKHNLNVKLIPVSWKINVFLSNAVEIMNMTIYNGYNLLLNSGLDEDEITVFPLSEYGINIPDDGIYCRKNYFDKNQQLCHDFTQASLDGWRQAMNKPDEAMTLVMQYLGKETLPANLPHQRRMLDKIRDLYLNPDASFGRLSENDYLQSAQLLYEYGFISRIPAYQDFVKYAAKR